MCPVTFTLLALTPIDLATPISKIALSLAENSLLVWPSSVTCVSNFTSDSIIGAGVGANVRCTVGFLV